MYTYIYKCVYLYMYILIHMYLISIFVSMYISFKCAMWINTYKYSCRFKSIKYAEVPNAVGNCIWLSST